MGQITIGENRVNKKLVHLNSIEFFFEARTCTPRIYIHKNGGGSLVPPLNSQWDLNMLETEEKHPRKSIIN